MQYAITSNRYKATQVILIQSTIPGFDPDSSFKAAVYDLLNDNAALNIIKTKYKNRFDYKIAAEILTDPMALLNHDYCRSHGFKVIRTFETKNLSYEHIRKIALNALKNTEQQPK